MTEQKEGAATGGVHIGGSATVHGDMVGGNQTKTVVQPQQGADIAQLRALIKEMRGLLPQAGLSADEREYIDGDFEVVEAQANRDEPPAKPIRQRLEGISKAIEQSGKTTEAAIKLGQRIKQAIGLVTALL